MRHARLAALALGLVLALPALADPPANSAAEADTGGRFAPCKDDVHKFCPDVQLGEGRMAHCMRMHYFRLSKQCKAAIKAARAARQSGASGDDTNQ